MKILQVCTSQTGGAGIAVSRLHKGLRSLDADSMMLVTRINQQDSHVFGPDNKFDKIMARLSPLLDRIPGQLSKPPLDRTSSSWAPNRLLRKINQLAPDIVNLHWVNDGYMRIETLPKINKPIVWTFHDMWPLAGGEHYVGESLRYKEGYHPSNRPTSETGLDINRWIWERKRKSWSNLDNLVIATPSEWLKKCAEESVLFRNYHIEVLPNGIDHERFHPMDHAISRKILGLPTNKILILFGAGSATRDTRKGFHLLVDALNKLDYKNLPTDCELIVFGASSSKITFPMKANFMGTLQDEISMALLYSAADVFVAPSVEDNLPNTVLESLSCGTPVVAFNIGGMPDMVLHKRNGYLASGFDTTELAEGLKWVVDDHQRWKHLSDAARSTVIESFTLQCSAERYLNIYKEMLN